MLEVVVLGGVFGSDLERVVVSLISELRHGEVSKCV